MEFTHVINQMLVLCVPILVGYLAARLGYLDEDLNTKLSRSSCSWGRARLPTWTRLRADWVVS
jgi:hypothetical protein